MRSLTANRTTTPCHEAPCFERFAVNSTHAAAAALEGGTTIECDRVYGAALPAAIAQNLTSIATLKRMVSFTLKTLIQAGMMDPLEKQLMMETYKASFSGSPTALASQMGCKPTQPSINWPSALISLVIP